MTFRIKTVTWVYPFALLMLKCVPDATCICTTHRFTLQPLFLRLLLSHNGTSWVTKCIKCDLGHIHCYGFGLVMSRRLISWRKHDKRPTQTQQRR